MIPKQRVSGIPFENNQFAHWERAFVYSRVTSEIFIHITLHFKFGRQLNIWTHPSTIAYLSENEHKIKRVDKSRAARFLIKHNVVNNDDVIMFGH